MPLPIPNTSETREHFITRCMLDLKGEFPDNDQRMGICNTQAEKRQNKLLFQNISGVEVFKEGTHNRDKFTAQDIEDFVVNFNLLKNKLIPKVKITHREDQKALAGLASYGDVKNVFTKTVGGIKRLFVDLIDVPDQVAQWIKDKRFSERSIEIFRNISIDGKKFKNVMVKVALLGHEIPAVAGMKPIELSLEIDSGIDVNNHLTLIGDETAIYYTYEPEDKDIICTFSVSDRGDTNLMDPLEILKQQFKEMNESLDALKSNITDEKSKAEYEAFSLTVSTFKSNLDALEKSSGDDMSKITTELEANKKELNTYKQKDVENKETLRKQDIDTFVSEMKEKGSVIPAFESDLKTLLYSLDNSEKTLDYKIKTQKDGDVDTKISTLEYAMKLFSKIGKIVEYSEIAPSKDPNMSDKNKKVSEDDKQVTIGTETFAVDGVEDDIEIKEYARKNECSYEDAAYAVLDAKEKEKQS